jgi:hypothetical protein
MEVEANMLNKQPADIGNKLTMVNTDLDIEIYDPPMCCPTGLCGPTIDQDLLDVSEMVHQLQTQGLRVERYQITTHPGKFTENPQVMGLIREKQMAALPITMVRGKIVADGYYPKLDEIQGYITRSN